SCPIRAATDAWTASALRFSAPSASLTATSAAPQNCSLFAFLHVSTHLLTVNPIAASGHRADRGSRKGAVMSDSTNNDHENPEEMPSTEELQEPSTEKSPGEEPKAPADQEGEPSHE